MTTFVPSEFAADRHRARAIVDANRLATVVSARLDVVQVPLVCVDPPGEPPRTMVGHVAAAGPFAVSDQVEVVAVHRGVEGYVSPSWYATKHEHGRAVPTWDYEAVHLRGTLHVSRDRDEVLAAVRLLTDLEESAFPAPWAVDDAPAAYVERLARAIVAIRLEVTEVAAVDKLSQNRSSADVAGVVTGLRDRDEHALADAVQRSSPA